MSEIIVYSAPNCNKCRRLKTILNDKKKVFREVTELSEIIKLGKEIGKSIVPFLYLNGRHYSGSEAIDTAFEL